MAEWFKKPSRRVFCIAMADTLSSKDRSRVMRTIRSKDSKIERDIRTALWRSGLRYRKNVTSLPGKPDLVFRRKALAVFIDSCFWHGCPEHVRYPSSNKEYWQSKISRNIQRDLEVNALFSKMKWTTIRIWEHELRSDFDECVERIKKSVTQ